MTLIARNRITEYINKHPEARITLLTWLKEYPYNQEERMFSDKEGKSIKGFGAGSAQPDLGVYSIKFRINYAAKAVFITWIGTRREHEEESEREFKELQRKHPDVKRIVKVATLTIKSPNLKSIKQSAESRQQAEVDSNTAFLLPADLEAITQINSNIDLFDERNFKTEAAYKQGLLRVFDIFDAKPETQEFDELLTLLRLVKYYEEYELKFPLLKAFEVVTHRMDMFQMISFDLAIMLESEDIYQFLSGKQELSPKTLTRLYKIVGIKFPISDRLFFDNYLL